MSAFRTVTIVADSPLQPERVLAAAHDFSQRRIEIWPAVQAEHFEVHDLTGTFADATEGTKFGPFYNYERCDYDWSEPRYVKATVTDSNIYELGSMWEIKATPSDAGSRVEMIWTRRFRSTPKGRFFGTVFRFAGNRLFGGYAREMLENAQKLEQDASPISGPGTDARA